VGSIDLRVGGTDASIRAYERVETLSPTEPRYQSLHVFGFRCLLQRVLCKRKAETGFADRSFQECILSLRASHKESGDREDPGGESGDQNDRDRKTPAKATRPNRVLHQSISLQ
jgi:hypothetical protein